MRDLDTVGERKARKSMSDDSFPPEVQLSVLAIRRRSADTPPQWAKGLVPLSPATSPRHEAGVQGSQAGHHQLLRGAAEFPNASDASSEEETVVTPRERGGGTVVRQAFLSRGRGHLRCLMAVSRQVETTRQQRASHRPPP